MYQKNIMWLLLIRNFCFLFLVTSYLGSNVKANVIQRCQVPQLDPQEMKECEQSSDATGTSDADDVLWFKKCVVKYYGLQPTPGYDETFKKPQFQGYFRSTRFGIFKKTALRIERFFLRNRDWEATKNNKLYRNLETGEDSNLLAITDARYLYVTYVLLIKSEFTLTACKVGAKIQVPKNVCFLPPYGSTTSTSDYDVGLVGHTSGKLTAAFNSYFDEKFKKPSEEVFDTNVYGYTLEYAMPQLYSGLSVSFMQVIPNLDLDPRYQMQELAGAYFKMLKFDESLYNDLKLTADPVGSDSGLGGDKKIKDVPNRKLFFRNWIKRYEKWNDQKKRVKGIPNLREEHNKIYSDLMTELEKTFDKSNADDMFRYMAQMGIALIYAAEAYHTRGAMRHVVGIIQMKKTIIKESITIMDYWVSMIENWADSNKEYQHCKPKVEECLLKMSKYLYRTFNAMRNLHTLLTVPVKVKNALKAAFPGDIPQYPNKGTKNDPEVIAKNWVDEFRGKKSAIPFQTEAMPFLNYFGCKDQKAGTKLEKNCILNIQKKVQEYNKLLIKTTTRPTTQGILMVMQNGQEKKKSTAN